MTDQDPDEIKRLRQALQDVQRQAHEREQDLQRQAHEREQDLQQQVREREQNLQEQLAQEREKTQEERQKAQEERQKTQKTSFPEFLVLCHELFTQKLQIQTDKSLATKGSITKPNGKKHPIHLRPWTDFPQTQQHYFDQAYSILSPKASPDRRYFTARTALEDRGHLVCRKLLASEKDLEIYERLAVEEEVKDILQQLMTMSEAQSLLNGCTGIEFENHLNTLSDNAAEVIERQRRSPTDQACVFRNVDGERQLLFVREYKAAHKLTVEYLRAGLRSMQVKEEVVDRVQIPTDVGEKLNYHADRLVAAAVTQTFEYMIDNGLEYSSIATGPAEVFLRVREDKPETVYYYLAEPALDAIEDGMTGFRYPFTAVSRMVGFCLMAFDSDIRDQAWRDAASKKLPIWDEDFVNILQKIPETARRATPPASSYKPPRYPVDHHSPYLTRQSRRKLFPADDSKAVFPTSQHSSSDDPPGDSYKLSDVFKTPSKTGSKRKRSSSSHQSSSDRDKAQAYCTQKCLLGLVRQHTLDGQCPNYRQHQSVSCSSSHALSITSFHERVQDQLTRDMDHNCTPLGKQGARGALFKITLVSHGYTFVGKGTVQAFVPDLCHEGRIYKTLEAVQGAAVPVCLGNMMLNRTYFLDVGVRIVHMLLLAWGGESLYEQTPPIPPLALRAAEQRSSQAVRELGVLHNDLRLANLLWNEELQRVLVIDFERSRLDVKMTSSSKPEALREYTQKKRLRSEIPGTMTLAKSGKENEPVAKLTE